MNFSDLSQQQIFSRKRFASGEGTMIDHTEIICPEAPGSVSSI
jgi:hypothetical protein